MITFLYIGIAIIIFTMIFFLSRRPFRLEDKIASIFLVFLGFPLLIKLILIGELKFPFMEIIPFFKSPLITYGPFLYLYAKFEIDPHPVFKKKYLLHFLPFPLFGLLALWEFSQVKFPLQKFILYFPLLSSFIVYTYFIMKLLSRHQKNVSAYFSFESIKLNLKWLRWITICFIISYLFIFFVIHAGLHIYIPIQRPLIPDISLLFFIFAFCFFALRQPKIFWGNSEAGIIQSGKIKTKKYEKSGLKKEEEGSYLNILEIFMETEKPYLNENLTIADISRDLHIPRHYLTQVINENFNKNFFMYINEYRIKIAEQMMTNSSYKDYTILRIAYESGFNSKASFNRIFKRFSGCTPTDYRKRINNSTT